MKKEGVVLSVDKKISEAGCFQDALNELPAV